MRFRWPMRPTELLLTPTGNACKRENILTTFKGAALFGHSCTWRHGPNGGAILRLVFDCLRGMGSLNLFQTFL